MDITFTKEKETPGTVRYKEDSDEPKIGTLYIKKAAATELDNPDKIKVTVQKV